MDKIPIFDWVDHKAITPEKAMQILNNAMLLSATGHLTDVAGGFKISTKGKLKVIMTHYSWYCIAAVCAILALAISLWPTHKN